MVLVVYVCRKLCVYDFWVFCVFWFCVYRCVFVCGMGYLCDSSFRFLDFCGSWF